MGTLELYPTLNSDSLSRDLYAQLQLSYVSSPPQHSVEQEKVFWHGDGRKKSFVGTGCSLSLGWV